MSDVTKRKLEMVVVTHFHFQHHIDLHIVSEKRKNEERPKSSIRIKSVTIYHSLTVHSLYGWRFLPVLGTLSPRPRRAYARPNHCQRHFLLGSCDKHIQLWNDNGQQFSIVREFNGFLSLLELLSFVIRIFHFCLHCWNYYDRRMEWDEQIHAFWRRIKRIQRLFLKVSERASKRARARTPETVWWCQWHVLDKWKKIFWIVFFSRFVSFRFGMEQP